MGNYDMQKMYRHNIDTMKVPYKKARAKYFIIGGIYNGKLSW